MLEIEPESAVCKALPAVLSVWPLSSCFICYEPLVCAAPLVAWSCLRPCPGSAGWEGMHPALSLLGSVPFSGRVASLSGDGLGGSRSVVQRQSSSPALCQAQEGYCSVSCAGYWQLRVQIAVCPASWLPFALEDSRPRRSRCWLGKGLSPECCAGIALPVSLPLPALFLVWALQRRH